MKVLLFGKNGQVGWELQRSLALCGTVIATDSSQRSPYLHGDLNDLAAIRATILQNRPAVIVNAAAYTNVDLAESEPEQANKINHLAPAAMAEAAHEIGALLVHYSTDYVFGNGGDYARTESGPVAPLNVYGESKLQGEIAVRASGCKHLIFRTSWVYAARGENFLKTMLRLAQERESLSVIMDQEGAPTGAELIADITALAIRACMRDEHLGGLYHLAANGHTNWHEYASFVIETARAYGAPIRLADSSAIQAITSKDYPRPAKRQHNSRLSTTKLTSSFDLHLPDWKQGVERVVRELLEQNKRA